MAGPFFDWYMRSGDACVHAPPALPPSWNDAGIERRQQRGICLRNPRRVTKRGAIYILGSKTRSTTWMTPFDWMTLGIVTWAV